MTRDVGRAPSGQATQASPGAVATPSPPSGEYPSRVQLRRTKGWRMPANTVKVDRSTKWGNPFEVGCNPSCFSAALPTHCETVEDAVRHYRYFAETWIALTNGRWLDALRGKHLACWCKAAAPCHADVLIELANRDSDGSPEGGDAKLGSVEDDSAAIAQGVTP